MHTNRYVTRDIATIGPDADLAAAAKVMRQHHVGFLVVVSERNGVRHPVGVLSDRDIVMESVAEDISPHELKVADVMTTHPLVASIDDDLEDLLAHMRENGVRRVPVVNKNGTLAGIVSFDDLLQTLSRMLGNMASSVINQRVTEIEMRKQ
ncbi:MAG: CBS domain-containing protein [Steroidobacter sp.]